MTDFDCTLLYPHCYTTATKAIMRIIIKLIKGSISKIVNNKIIKAGLLITGRAVKIIGLKRLTNNKKSRKLLEKLLKQGFKGYIAIIIAIISGAYIKRFRATSKFKRSFRNILLIIFMIFIIKAEY